jgi:hypothetical protein
MQQAFLYFSLFLLLLLFLFLDLPAPPLPLVGGSPCHHFILKE